MLLSHRLIVRRWLTTFVAAASAAQITHAIEEFRDNYGAACFLQTLISSGTRGPSENCQLAVRKVFVHCIVRPRDFNSAKSPVSTGEMDGYPRNTRKNQSRTPKSEIFLVENRLIVY